MVSGAKSDWGHRPVLSPMPFLSMVPASASLTDLMTDLLVLEALERRLRSEMARSAPKSPAYSRLYLSLWRIYQQRVVMANYSAEVSELRRGVLDTEAKMNKTDLAEQLSADHNISKSAATRIVDSLIAKISSALKKGEHVTLSGFGTFSTYQRQSRTGRDPQTGALIKIASRRVAKFTPGTDLKRAVGRK